MGNRRRGIRRLRNGVFVPTPGREWFEEHGEEEHERIEVEQQRVGVEQERVDLHVEDPAEDVHVPIGDPIGVWYSNHEGPPP